MASTKTLMELTRRTVPLRQMNLLIKWLLIMERGKTWLKWVNRVYKHLGKIKNDLQSLCVNLRYPRYRRVHYLKRGRHTESRQSDAHRDIPETILHSDCHTVRTASYSWCVPRQNRNFHLFSPKNKLSQDYVITHSRNAWNYSSENASKKT